MNTKTDTENKAAENKMNFSELEGIKVTKTGANKQTDHAAIYIM